MSAAKPARKKIAFTALDKDGGELKLCVKLPSAAAKSGAKLHGSRRYGEALDAGVKLMAHVDKYLREHQLWSDADEDAFDALVKVIADGEEKLARGGIRKSEARSIALAVRDARDAAASMLAVRREVEGRTAEALERQAQFEYYVAACTFWDDGDRQGQPYFARPGEMGRFSVDAYVERADEPDAIEAASKFAELYYGGGESRRTAEEKFLFDQGFADEDGRLIDKEGRPVDYKGRLVDDEGYLVDEEGRRVGRDGEPVREVEFTPFLDDEEDAGGYLQDGEDAETASEQGVGDGEDPDGPEAPEA